MAKTYLSSQIQSLLAVEKAGFKASSMGNSVWHGDLATVQSVFRTHIGNIFMAYRVTGLRGLGG